LDASSQKNIDMGELKSASVLESQQSIHGEINYFWSISNQTKKSIKKCPDDLP